MGRFRLWIATFLTQKFGKCARCMRIALRCAVGAWVGVEVLSWTRIDPVILNTTLFVASGLTLLTLLHVMFFARRNVVAAGNYAHAWRPSQDAHTAPPLVSGKPLAGALSRRQAVSLFARGALVASLASIAFPRRADASCGDCGSGWLDCITNYCGTQGQVCCPQGYPYLNHCDCTCYDGTNFDCSSYSNCNYCG